MDMWVSWQQEMKRAKRLKELKDLGGRTENMVGFGSLYSSPSVRTY